MVREDRGVGRVFFVKFDFYLVFFHFTMHLISSVVGNSHLYSVYRNIGKVNCKHFLQVTSYRGSVCALHCTVLVETVGVKARWGSSVVC